MKPLLLLIAVMFSILAAPGQNLGKRVIQHNSSTYRLLPAVHTGARQVKFTELIGNNALAANFLYLYAGEIAAKSGIGRHFHPTKGTGTLHSGTENAPIGADDTLFTQINEKRRTANTGSSDPQLLVNGISPNGKRTIDPPNPTAMVLQMDFVVVSANSDAFEKMYHSIYVPAMLVQQGYLSSKLLRLYPAALGKEIEAEPTEYNYQIQISFDTEQNRRKWVASPQHQIAWPAATSLAKSFKWRGYDVAGENDN